MNENDQSELEAKGYRTRAATLEDVERVVDLINAAAMADTGMKDTHKDDKLIEWGLPEFHLDTDTMLVLAADRELAGLVELWDSEPHVRHCLYSRVHPDHRGRGIGRHLMAWAEARAGRSLDKAPPEARVSIHTSAVRQNVAAHELFEARGYTLARHFFRMLAEMAPDAPPPTPERPEGISLRPLVMGQDDRAAHRTIDEAFQDHWGYVQGESFEEWMHWIEDDPNFDPSVCLVAEENGSAGKQMVGVLMARPEWEGDSSIAWVDELAVLRPWRRRGIALALLQQVFGEFHRRGRYKVGLGVDGESLTGALRLYEKAGMRVFRQNDAYEKTLRPGRDLSTQSLED
jgi:mycothiol synthase